MKRAFLALMLCTSLFAGCASSPRGTPEHPYWLEGKPPKEGFQPASEEFAEHMRFLREAVRVQDADMVALGEAHATLVGYLVQKRLNPEGAANVGGTHFRVIEHAERERFWLSQAAGPDCPTIVRGPTYSMPSSTTFESQGQSSCAYGSGSQLAPERRRTAVVIEVWLVSPENIRSLPDHLRPPRASYL